MRVQPCVKSLLEGVLALKRAGLVLTFRTVYSACLLLKTSRVYWLFSEPTLLPKEILHMVCTRKFTTIYRYFLMVVLFACLGQMIQNTKNLPITAMQGVEGRSLMSFLVTMSYKCIMFMTKLSKKINPQ